MFSFLVITAVSFPVGCIFAVATCLPFKRPSQSWPCQKDAEFLLSNALFLSQFLANKITVFSSTIVSFAYHVQLYLFITFMDFQLKHTDIYFNIHKATVICFSVFIRVVLIMLNCLKGKTMADRPLQGIQCRLHRTSRKVQ